MSKRPWQGEEGQANCRDRSGNKHKYLYLVLDDWHGGFTIRKLEPDSPDLSAPPVARLGSFMRYSPMNFAAMGSRIIATTHNYAATLVFDTETTALAMGNPLPDALLDGINTFLTAGDVLFAFAYYFRLRPQSFEVMTTTKDEMLSLCPSTDWSWKSMPTPFIKDERIESYALHPDGQTIFVSTYIGEDSGGTFSFDTKNREWKRHGEWMFPFQFQGYFDADLDAWVGLHQDGYICSCQVPSVSSSFSTMQQPNWKIAKEHKLWSPYHQLAKGRGATLTYMGNSKFFLVDSVAADGLKFRDAFGDRGCVLNMTTFRLRLFTAADSDDICTAIRFINSKRPWTTIMGVGWGYGANMLTKYLVEVGESTPLTAAVCIDNPFDLQEATRSFPHNIALDQKLTTGLVDILRANKELFQGKDKDFDVRKALSANCLRDFDGAISMVSHGFATVDDFYAENSMRLSVACVKIPVLFIQSDDGTVPLLSVPRSSISENPFTSLLLCSCVHSTVFTFERYTALWCQNLTLEWLSAVEFALLKGRHPLIKDVDITINPSKGLAFVEPQPNNNKVPKDNNFREQSQYILYNNVPHGINGLLTGSANGYVGAENSESGLLEDNGDMDRVSKDSDEEDSEESSGDDEKGHVLQSASLVMNMLDATMPGTLDDDQKKKVMVAVEQGESLVKALEEAVPEDVRGKLTTSVTEILQSKRGNFSLEALKRLGWTNARSTSKSMVQEKVKESDPESGLKDAKMLDQDRIVTSIGEGDQKDTNMTSSDSNPGEGIDLSQGKPHQTSGTLGTGTESGSEQTQLNKSEKGNSGVNESSEEQHRTDQGSETAPRNVSDDQSTANSNGAPREQVQSADSSAEPNPQSNMLDKEGDAVHANEDKVAQNVVDQSMQLKTEESKPPPVNVTQALDALTGFDDSTQMAVNSVFGVLENMIDQFQKRQNLKFLKMFL